MTERALQWAASARPLLLPVLKPRSIAGAWVEAATSGNPKFFSHRQRTAPRSAEGGGLRLRRHPIRPRGGSSSTPSPSSRRRHSTAEAFASQYGAAFYGLSAQPAAPRWCARMDVPETLLPRPPRRWRRRNDPGSSPELWCAALKAPDLRALAPWLASARSDGLITRSRHPHRDRDPIRVIAPTAPPRLL